MSVMDDILKAIAKFKESNPEYKVFFKVELLDIDHAPETVKKVITSKISEPEKNSNEQQKLLTKEDYKKLYDLFKEGATKTDYLDLIFKLQYEHFTLCPKCLKTFKYSRLSSRPAYMCYFCRNQIYPLSATIFRKSPIPITTWMAIANDLHKDNTYITTIQEKYNIKYEAATRIVRLFRQLFDLKPPPPKEPWNKGTGKPKIVRDKSCVWCGKKTSKLYCSDKCRKMYEKKLVSPLKNPELIKSEPDLEQQVAAELKEIKQEKAKEEYKTQEFIDQAKYDTNTLDWKKWAEKVNKPKPVFGTEYKPEPTKDVYTPENINNSMVRLNARAEKPIPSNEDPSETKAILVKVKSDLKNEVSGWKEVSKANKIFRNKEEWTPDNL